MTTESQRDQAERKAMLENDRRVREQEAGTYFSHATDSEPGGRFLKAEGPPHVVGTSPIPRYPALPGSSPWSGEDVVGQEPPLGFQIDAMPALEPSAATSAPVEATGPTADAPVPSPCGDAPVGPLSPSENVGHPPNERDGNDAA
jgi:hypothetical protein